MKRQEVRMALECGKTLKELFRFRDGQGCEIVKEDFRPSDDIIYIPDISTLDFAIDAIIDEEDITDLLMALYTGNDILRICNGNEKLARYLYSSLDWASPEMELDSLDLEDDDDAMREICGKTWEEVFGKPDWETQNLYASSENKFRIFRKTKKDSYLILQLMRTETTASIRFMNLGWLRKKGKEPQIKDYEAVYVEGTGEDMPNPIEEMMDRLYARFQLNLPEGYRGHSLSVSDVVLVRKEKMVKAYYVDSIGFRELPEFLDDIDFD